MGMPNEVGQGFDQVEVVGIRPGIRDELDGTSGDLNQWVDQGSQLAGFSTPFDLGFRTTGPG